MAIKLKTWNLADGVITGSATERTAYLGMKDRIQYNPRGPYYDAVIADGADGYWRMDEGEGTTIANEIVGGLVGTATTPLWTGGEGPHTGGFRKNFSSRFEGNINEKYTVLQHAAVDFQDSVPFTIEFWWNKNSGPLGTLTAFQQGLASATSGVEVQFNTSLNRIEWLLQAPASSQQMRRYFTTPFDFDTDQDEWNHYVFVYDPNIVGPLNVENLICIVNGTSLTHISQLNSFSTDSFENAGDLVIGGQVATSQTIRGLMSDFAVYNGVALSTAQALDHYNKRTATGAETAQAVFSFTLDAPTYPFGGEVKELQIPGCLGRHENASGPQRHTRTFVSINAGAEVEVFPNEPAPAGITIPASGTIDLIVRFYSDATFESGIGPSLYEQSSGIGPSILIDNQITSSGGSGDVEFLTPPLGRPDQFMRDV